MAIKDWVTTAADNDDADSDINLVGNAASIRTADNSMRAIMQKVKIWVDDNNGSRSTAGSSNTYTYASAGSASTPTDAFAAYATGDTLTIQANHTNTGAATLNVDSVGAKAIRKYFAGVEAALDANDIISAAPFTVIYDADANSAAGAWILQNPAIIRSSVMATPVSLSGESVDFTIPSWANCVDILIDGASWNGTAFFFAMLGDAGGAENSGYAGSNEVNGSRATFSNAFPLTASAGDTNIAHGILSLRCMSTNRRTWAASGGVSFSNTGAVTQLHGTKTLSDTLTFVRLAVTTGFTFDAGTATVVYW